MDNKIIEQLREEAKDALIHWAKTGKGYFMMKDALEKYFGSHRCQSVLWQQQGNAYPHRWSTIQVIYFTIMEHRIL